jgi:hypothetical protein
VLAVTSNDEPFVTADVQLAAAERAKETYPRSVIFDVSVHHTPPEADRWKPVTRPDFL